MNRKIYKYTQKKQTYKFIKIDTGTFTRAYICVCVCVMHLQIDKSIVINR